MSKSKRKKVKQGEPTLPWEQPHPSRGHKRNKTKGNALKKKYPLTKEKYDPIDHRLPGSLSQ